MEYIKSKDIFLLTRDILKLIYPGAMEHGSKVAYIVYKMLAEQGRYEEFELADIVMLSTLHDIGAYKTEKGKMHETLRYETKENMAHSIYGYLFLKDLSPIPELAKVIMYHHTDYERLKNVDYAYKEIAAYINLAEKIDIYSTSMGDKFDVRIFQKQAGTKFSPAALDLFYQCETKYGVFEQIRTEAYQKELDDIVEYMIFNNEDKKKFLEMLMYCMGFFNENFVVDTVTTVCICEELAVALNLQEFEREILYYGALVHDIGMLAIPREIIEAPRKLKAEEIKLVRTHVETAGKQLNARMKNEVVQVAMAHHERGDGSGYPHHMRDGQMNQMQRILQLADMVGAMVNKRSYRDALPKEKVIAIIKDEVSNNRIRRQVATSLVGYYDAIMQKVRERAAEILKMYQNLNLKYKQVSQKYKI